MTLTKQKNTGALAEEEVKRIFNLSNQVVYRGKPMPNGSKFKAILDGVAYTIDYNTTGGSDEIMISTDSWGANICNPVGPSGSREHKMLVWKGELPENLDDILIKLKEVQHEDN
jgi:hypothetical protein